MKRNIRSLRAYEAEEVPCRIKLDANESPFGLRVLKNIRTNRYPDPAATALRNAAARHFRIEPSNILHGNGSDELISCLITTFGGPVLFPVPTFSMYGIIAQALGERRVPVPLSKNFDLNVQTMKKAIARTKPKLVFLSSPNNPTGNCFSDERVQQIVENTEGLVVVDEAYHAFSGRKGFLPLVQTCRNLIVLKTLSKVGYAALRVGFAMADADIIHEINKVRLPFNVNSLSQRIAEDAFRGWAAEKTRVQFIVRERKRLFREMEKMREVTPFPSDANFILFRVADPEGIFRGLLNKGVLVRDMKGAIRGCLRVTVGSGRENTIFLKTLGALIGSDARRR